MCHLVIGFLPVIDWHSYCNWFIPIHGGIITLLTHLHSYKLFGVASFESLLANLVSPSGAL